MNDGNERISPQTLAVHGGERRPGPEGSLVFPIYQGTVFTPPPGSDYHSIPYIRINSTPSQRYSPRGHSVFGGTEVRTAKPRPKPEVGPG